MAHITVRHYQSKSGLKWTATQAVWNADSKKYEEKKIDPVALIALGFSENMTPDQAKAQAKKLNALKAIERKEQSVQVKAGERLTDLITIKNSIVPEELSVGFVKHIEDNWFGGEYNLRKQILHWNLVQRILTDLKIQPHEYFKKQKDFYKHFQKLQISKSYVEKLIKIINQWGEFYSEQSRTYFKRLPNPTGLPLQAIVDASVADGEGATPLTVPLLMKMRSKMPEGQWEYLRATLWLGLRPVDLDYILENPTSYKVSMQEGTKVLSVYQPKLTSVPKDKRWKNIPLYHSEMEQALQDIENDVIRKPLVKTIKNAAPSVEGIGLYSGRKGFTDLHLNQGQKLENVSLWLGHTSIERTWKHYKNKNIVEFAPIKKRKSS